MGKVRRVVFGLLFMALVFLVALIAWVLGINPFEGEDDVDSDPD